MDAVTVDTSLLPVSEIFSTIQGEGYHVGKPAIFVRLQGCPVGCPWCDTKYTWELDQDKRRDIGEVFNDVVSPGQGFWTMATPGQIFDRVQQFRSTHVVISGGEPCLYDLTELTTLLIDGGFYPQIETSGTHEIRCHERTWATVSPKQGMPGGFEVRDDCLARANEIKQVIGKSDDLIKFLALLDREQHSIDTPIFLSPLSLSKKSTELAVQSCIANAWRLSLQTHQLIGVR